jgi:iron complex outermembrane receptor protein
MIKNMLLASAAIVATISPAFAQEEPNPTNAQSQEPQTGNSSPGDIIVTARKRNEGLNDIAEAVTAFTSEKRQLLGINSLSDFAKFTPGLTYDSSSDRVFLRGIGRTTNTAGTDAGVATYADGIYDSSTSAVSRDDFFIQRVEVLRGPQGTLYGRNSIGGAINAISKRPTDEFSAEARAMVGNYDTQSYQASASGSLSQGFRGRLAGNFSRQGDGYFHNVSGGPSEGGAGRSYYVEGQVEGDVGSNATIWVKASTNGSNGRPRTANYVTPYDYGAYPSGFLTPGGAFGYLLPGYAAQGPATTNPGVDNPRNFSTNTVSRQRYRDSFGIQGQFDWHLDAFDVRALGGYRQYKYDTVADLDNTSVQSYSFPLATGALCGLVPGCAPLTVQPSQAFKYLEDRKFGSAELNILSKKGGPLNWIAGLYYYHERLNQTTDFNSIDQLQLRTPVNGPANPSGDFVYAAARLKTDSYAAFGQIDWDVTKTIRLTGGLRYSKDKKSVDESIRVICLACVPGTTPDQLGSLAPALDLTASAVSFADAPGVVRATAIDPATGNATRGLSDSWDAVTGTAGIQWRPSKGSLAYATYSRGYKSGGFNAGGIIAAPEAKPEFVNAFEAGIKQTLGPVQLNIAGYYYAYKGLQVPLTIPVAGINLTTFANLESAKSYGVELESSWNVTRQLQLLFNYAYADSKVTSCCYIDVADPTGIQSGAQPAGAPVGGQQFQSLTGNRLPMSPKNKLTISGIYTVEFDPGSVSFSASYDWRSNVYTNVFNRYYYRVPSAGTLDMRLLWTAKDDRYRVILFAKNVLNTLNYDTAVNSTGTNAAQPYAMSPDPRYSVNYSLGVAPPRTFGAQFQVKF